MLNAELNATRDCRFAVRPAPVGVGSIPLGPQVGLHIHHWVKSDSADREVAGRYGLRLTFLRLGLPPK